MRSAKGYRTFIVTVLKLALDSGVLSYLLLVDWTTAGFTEKTAVWIAIGLSVADKLLTVGMRMVTDTPAFANSPTPQQAADAIKERALSEARAGLAAKRAEQEMLADLAPEHWT